ncbi:transposase [Arthrobacter sp. CAN_A6]
MTRQLGHEPFGWRPTTLLVRIRRYRCTGCGHVWRQDASKAAEPRAKLSRRGLRWALEGIVCQHLTVARIAEGLGVTWNTANKAVLAEGRRVLIDDPDRFDGVKVIGVDEHVWRHTRRGDKYVTVIIDLTPIRDGTGPSRLLDMVEGRSKQAFATWLQERPQHWRDGVEVVAMDGFSGFKSAAAEELPDAVPVMDPFHVIRLAGDALDNCRRRVQQQTCGHRGRVGDPLYSARRAQDVLAYFERPGTSNGPAEAINGRLEHLRGSALGFRNLTNYVARSLLESGGFRPKLHSQF